MKAFKLTANIEFEAENIDDAFALLAKHFKALEEGSEPEGFFTGTFDIKPVA